MDLPIIRMPDHVVEQVWAAWFGAEAAHQMMCHRLRREHDMKIQALISIVGYTNEGRTEFVCWDHKDRAHAGVCCPVTPKTKPEELQCAYCELDKLLAETNALADTPQGDWRTDNDLAHDVFHELRDLFDHPPEMASYREILQKAKDLLDT